MKIRHGFVSNSSTSSYLVICKKEDHDKALENLHPYYQAWVKEKLKPEQEKFAGHDVMVSELTVSSEDDAPFKFDGELPEESEVYWGQVWDAETGEYLDGEENEIKWVSSDISILKYQKALEKITKDSIIRDGYS